MSVNFEFVHPLAATKFCQRYKFYNILQGTWSKFFLQCNTHCTNLSPTILLETTWVETLCPKLGFFLCFTDININIAFPPPVPYIQCSAAVQVTYRKQKTPQLWMEGTRGGVWMLLFPQVTLFEYTVPTPLSPIVPNGYKSYMCLDLLTSSLMNVSRDSCAFSTSCGGPSRETLSFSSLNSTWTWNQVNWLLNTVKPLQMGTSLQRPCSRYPAEYQELSMPNDWPAFTSHGLIGQSG